MGVTDAKFAKGFFKMAGDGYRMDWHERNGGNLSYRLTADDVETARAEFNPAGWNEIGLSVTGLAGEYFLVTGTGKYLSNVEAHPAETCGVVEIDKSGGAWRAVWGFAGGGAPTSELATHLLGHEVNKKIAGRRVIYHCHPANIIALTFVLPLDDKTFTNELWQTMTECMIIFPRGVGVLPWMVPGGTQIAASSVEKLERYDAIIWAHHGIFCSGDGFDDTFELAHTIEKAAEIAVKIRSMTPERRRRISAGEFRALAKAYGVNVNEEFLEGI